MTDQRWQRTKALFQAAVERPPGERAAFVAAAAADDADLRREVEALLASDAADRSVLDRWPLAGAAAIAPASSGRSGEETLCEAALKPGHYIGPYQVVTLIGAGNMGQVYRARDTRLNRDVALKVLPDVSQLDLDRMARLKREAQLLAALNHPNVAAIYGFEESEGRHALVLELVDGPTLADLVARGPMRLAEVVGLARQIAEGLEAAHDKGIIHRDLKPANIKVTGAGVVKVLDFGLAKVWDGAADAAFAASPTLTATALGERAILGTPAYMSPEQARGRPLDKRTDIWSFACVLFEMLTGRAAFGGETISDTLARVLEHDVDWNALPVTCPSRIRELLRRCLQKEVSRRLRDIGDARLELDEVGAPGGQTDSIGSHRPANRAIVRSRLFQAAAAVAVTSVAIAGLMSGGDAQVSQPTFRQLTFRHGSLRGARLARDGLTTVYSAAWIGTPQDVYVIRPESVQSGAIGVPNAGIFSVSPKGDLAIALGCRLNWGECIGTLAQVPITGGVPRELVKDVQGADFSPDGQNLAVVSFAAGRFRLEYPMGKVLYEPSGWITYARLAPKCDRIAFLDHPALGDIGGSVAVIDVDGKKVTLSSGWKALQGLAWWGTGDEIWFTGSRTGKGGSSALYAVTLDGRERQVFASPGALKLHDISADGQRVLLTRGTTRGGIVSLGSAAAQERELSWFDYSTVADLSRDGTMLLFYEWGEGVAGKPTIFIRGTDGKDAIRLGEGRPLALHPDGQWAVAVQDETSTRMVLLPTRTGDVKSLPRGTIAEYLDWAAWSPDRRRIYFAGRDASDVRRTYVQDVDRGDPRPITRDGFVGVLLSPDGQTLATVDRYGEYYLYPLDGKSDPHPLPGYVDGDVLLQWSADGRFMFIREAGNLTLRIYRLEISTGARELWRELVPPDPTVLVDIGSDPGQVRITPDGKAYAYTYWTFAGELYVAEGLR